MGSPYLVCNLVALVLQCDDIHHFHLVQIALDIRKPLFVLVNCPKHCIELMVRMVIVLCMVRHISLEYMPIYLDSHHHIYILVQWQRAAVHSTKVDFHLVRCQDICSSLHDFERSKQHLVHTVMIVRMDSRNGC